MGYYDSEFNEAESDYARLHRWPLPEEFQARLLKKEDVEKRLADGEDPVDLSIEKWKRIIEVYQKFSEDLLPYKYYYGLYEQIGYDTCALCLSSTQLFIQRHGRLEYQNDKCRVCRLADVERCTSKGSTYLEIDHLLYEETGVERTPFKSGYEDKNVTLGKLLHKMLANIESLKTSG